MSQLDVSAALRAIASVLPPRRPIEHHEPCISGNENQIITKALNDDPVGDKYVRLMQDKLREISGRTQALVVNSGTAALELILRAMDIGPGDEVLVPSLTFVATANAVSHTGAIPHFIDGALGINAFKLRQYLGHHTHWNADKRQRINTKTGRPIKALIVVHLLGHAADMSGIEEIAHGFGLPIIEDAAEALGSRLGDRACGSFGAASIFSFNCNKICTTGGGGALLTDDGFILARAYLLATTSRLPHPWLVEHDAKAWNYRLSGIAAALGYAQLLQLTWFMDAKRELSNKYASALSDIKGLKFLNFDIGANCWLNAIKVDDPSNRDVILKELHDVGIKARALFTPMHMLPMYRNCPQDRMGYCEDTWRRTICLPSGARLVSESFVG